MRGPTLGRLDIFCRKNWHSEKGGECIKFSIRVLLSGRTIQILELRGRGPLRVSLVLPLEEVAGKKKPVSPDHPLVEAVRLVEASPGDQATLMLLAHLTYLSSVLVLLTATLFAIRGGRSGSTGSTPRNKTSPTAQRQLVRSPESCAGGR